MRTFTRSALALITTSTALVAAATGPAPPAQAQGVSPMSGGYESAVLSRIERRRHRHGLRDVDPSGCVDRFAERRSNRMGVRDEMVHYGRLGRVLRRCGGGVVGEIIARGRGYGDPAALVRAWMRSPSHRAVILDGRFAYATVGAWRDGDGEVFVSVVFRDA